LIEIGIRDSLLLTGELQKMNTFRNFILRFLIIVFPAFLVSFAFFNFRTLTKLEITLMSLLSLGLPWLLYELVLHYDHQSKANKALLSFCKSMERIVTGISSLERTSKEAPKEMMAELHIMQSLMGQIMQEKEKTQYRETKPVETDTDTNASSATSAEPAFASPSTTRLHNSEEETADIVGTKQTSPEPQNKASEPEVKEKSPSLTRAELLNIIEKALNNDRIEMLVQPIVSLPQRKARHFECFSRIREEDGTIYTPDHFLHLAEEENLIRLVDNAMLFRCIQLARASAKKNFDVSFFCNISQHTLSDKFFFESLSEFLHSNRDLAQHIVFEFHEEAIIHNLSPIEPLIKKLRLFDCRFSVDQVTRLDLDIKHLKNLNFKYIKFHSPVLIKELSRHSGSEEIGSFKKECDLNNMDVILSHIEDEEALLKLNDFHFDYGQGFLFGSPVLSKR